MKTRLHMLSIVAMTLHMFDTITISNTLFFLQFLYLFSVKLWANRLGFSNWISFFFRCFLLRDQQQCSLTFNIGLLRGKGWFWSEYHDIFQRLKNYLSPSTTFCRCGRHKCQITWVFRFIETVGTLEYQPCVSRLSVDL